MMPLIKKLVTLTDDHGCYSMLFDTSTGVTTSQMFSGWQDSGCKMVWQAAYLQPW